MRLKDKTAIVTGAGSGFGKGIAIRFAKEGARVGVIDINAEAAREVASQIGNSAFAMEADVSIDGDVSRMVQEALDRWGQLDILVNNAGTTHRNQPMTEVTEEEYERIFAVNVKSVYLRIREIKYKEKFKDEKDLYPGNYIVDIAKKIILNNKNEKFDVINTFKNTLQLNNNFPDSVNVTVLL